MAHPVPYIAWTAEPVGLVLVVGACLKIMPAIAAFFAVLWYLFCMWESRIGLRWRSRWRGLYYHAMRYPMPNPEIKALRRQLDDMQRASADRLLVAAGVSFIAVAASFVFAAFIWSVT